MSLRILLTGRDGQLGRALTPLLPRFGTVVATSRAEFDLSCPAEIAAHLEELAPDLIINAAAFTDVDGAETQADQARAVNADAPRLMAEWSKIHGAALLTFSTDYVHGGESERAYTEDDAPTPLGIYGATKAAGDAHVLASGCVHLIIRTAWLFDSVGRNFLTTIAERARSQTELGVVADQVGPPTSAALLAEITCAILSQGTDARAAIARHPGLVHATASGETSRYIFAQAIVDGLRARGVALAVERIRALRTVDLASPARRPLNSRLNLARLNADFGIAPSDWRIALEPELDLLATRLPP